jgi:hypothetical protein
MARKNEPFGKKSTILIVGAPDVISSIPEKVKDAFNSVGDFFDELSNSIENEINNMFNEFVEKIQQEIVDFLLEEINNWIEDLASGSYCGGALVLLLPTGLLMKRGHSRASKRGSSRE